MMETKDLSKLVIYEVYVRNHTPSGKFLGIIEDLDRIQALGVDAVWLMPIHPIGIKGRKGIKGSPYAIYDYGAVNPEYGTLEDFKTLIEKIHKKNMKCLIDVVYNHTSRDSVLSQTNPEYFYKNENGEFGNKIETWSDVYDLDYTQKNLWNVQINYLLYWAKLGVDGFRCDVASMVPISFWKRAVEELETINPNIIWLAETCEPDFIEKACNMGVDIQDDKTMYQAFDITYDYDVYPKFLSYLRGETPLDDYLNALKMQENIYPEGYLKLRFVENHDQKRARSLLNDTVDSKIWTAFNFFLKGPMLIYAGQETFEKNTPSLFDKDPVQWDRIDPDMVGFLTKLAAIKKTHIPATGCTIISNPGKAVTIRHKDNNGDLIGIFNVEKNSGKITMDIKDGIYTDLISGNIIEIKDGEIELTDLPIIFSVTKKLSQIREANPYKLGK